MLKCFDLKIGWNTNSHLQFQSSYYILFGNFCCETEKLLREKKKSKEKKKDIKMRDYQVSKIYNCFILF